MPTRAFKMHLHAGQIETYRQRHDAIWPELVAALRQAGIDDYRIFIDPETLTLFAVMTHRDAHHLDNLPALPVMQRWWAHMADIMRCGPDNVPVSTDLAVVFTLPKKDADQHAA